MERKFLFLIGLLVVLGAVAMVSTAATTSSGTSTTDQSTQRLIHTQATGEVLTTPDRADIQFAVETHNPDVQAAQAENAQRMTACMDALKKAGIPNDSLQTTGYSITPVYSDQVVPQIGSSTPVPVTTVNRTIQSYTVTNTLMVKLTDVSRAGGVIDLTIAAGANRADSLSFSLSDAQTGVLRKQAIAQAVNKSRIDADAAAAALGVNVGLVQDISIDSLSSPIYYASTGTAAIAPAATPSTPITPGTTKVTAQVSVEYLIG